MVMIRVKFGLMWLLYHFYCPLIKSFNLYDIFAYKSLVINYLSVQKLSEYLITFDIIP